MIDPGPTEQPPESAESVSTDDDWDCNDHWDTDDNYTDDVGPVEFKAGE